VLLKQLTTMEKKENKKRGRKRRKGGREMRGRGRNDLNRYSTKDVWVEDKHMKTCSTLLVLGKWKLKV